MDLKLEHFGLNLCAALDTKLEFHLSSKGPIDALTATLQHLETKADALRVSEPVRGDTIVATDLDSRLAIIESNYKAMHQQLKDCIEEHNARSEALAPLLGKLDVLHQSVDGCLASFSKLDCNDIAVHVHAAAFAATAAAADTTAAGWAAATGDADDPAVVAFPDSDAEEVDDAATDIVDEPAKPFSPAEFLRLQRASAKTKMPADADDSESKPFNPHEFLRQNGGACMDAAPT